jgi:hypothetical protein
MAELKHPLADFLNGRTARCSGYNMTPGHQCDQRAPTMEATLCHRCACEKNWHEYKEAFARAPSEAGGYHTWFMVWDFYDEYSRDLSCRAFVCRTCGDRRNACDFGVPDELGNSAQANLVPAAACCTNTMHCKLAEAFWGQDCNRAYHKMLDYIRDVRGKNL